MLPFKSDLWYNSDVYIYLHHPYTTNVVNALSVNVHKDVTFDKVFYRTYNIRNLELESLEELDLDRTPCNNDPNYSFEKVSYTVDILKSYHNYIAQNYILYPLCSV